MGKYIKKAKASCEVAVMEMAAQSHLGVRTRARALALQKDDSADSSSYLQLRSRRLEKPKETPCSNSSTKLDSKPSNSPKGRRNANSVARGGSVQSCEKVGENVLEADARSRNVRETTPSSLIRDSDNIQTPGSTTRPTTSTAASRRLQNSMNRSIPTTDEMEEFFAGAEQRQQRIFVEKYNFDPVNDLPLPGRYEWVRVDS